ncbi:MAG: PilZ domain-containing protein [Desulfomonile tiedjei]|nr:PilZ domain-containing protein [Desulfomonile tiedjei]
MASKRKIEAKDIVSEIKSGMTGPALSEKYKLSYKELRFGLTQLLLDKAITDSEFSKTICTLYFSDDADPTGVRFDDIELENIRRFHRLNAEFAELALFDAKLPGNRGRVLDISEDGIQALGIEASVKEVKSLTMTVSGVPAIPPISFEGECMWMRREPSTGLCFAGFEIVTIADADLQQLRRLIEIFKGSAKTHK